MFAVKDVKRALRWIFSLYDDEDVSILLEDDDEDVLSALMPEELSRKYKREARNISMFWASRGPKDKGSWSGSKLFKKKAAVLCAINMDSRTTSNHRVESRSELWLLSNMRFAEVHCVRSIALRKNRPVSITECRTLVKYVKKSSDLFVDAYTLFCQLDDTGLFEKLLGDKNMVCDF